MYIITMEPLSKENTRQFYFFIGRTTPPHFGHIHVLRQTIELARTSGTCALILLGNGPSGGVRTHENPVEHDTKAAFIRHKLEQLNYVDNTDFIIQMMQNPPNRQVVEFVTTRIPENVSQASIFQVAGGKDDDASKHAFVRTSTCNSLTQMYVDKEISFNCGVVTIDPQSGGTAETGLAMSATKVRNKAVECYQSSGENLDKAFVMWLDAFPFYSGDEETLRLSREIFEQIIRYKDTILPTQSKTKKQRPSDEGVLSYVTSRTAKKGPSTDKGGSRRKRNRHHRVNKLRNNKTLRNKPKNGHKRN